MGQSKMQTVGSWKDLKTTVPVGTHYEQEKRQGRRYVVVIEPPKPRKD